MFRSSQLVRSVAGRLISTTGVQAGSPLRTAGVLPQTAASMSTVSRCPFTSGDFTAVAAKTAQTESKCPFHQTPNTTSATSAATGTVIGNTNCRREFTAASAQAQAAAAPAAPQGLTPEQTAIIKATVPILETGGVALTKHFYSLLMKNETARTLFNQTHQFSGAQPRALAFSVLSYAKNIDQLQNLGPLVEQIVHKHCSFHVMPEHYPIVGENLLRAIREVLGPQVATDAVIDAWAKAYQQLADILIAAEAKVYDEIAAAPGGWRGSREFVVKAKTPASPDGSIVSFDLVPKDGKDVIRYVPGQYIGIRVRLGDKEEARRNYSLSQAADSKSLRITVKRVDGGLISTHLHDRVQVGDSIEVLSPAGDFVLKHAEEPLALISAGVGITPTMAMLQEATASTAPKRKIAFVHYTKSPETHAFAKEVDEIAQHAGVNVFTSYTDPKAPAASSLRGRVNSDHLNQVIAALGPVESINAYVLGPEGFMKTVKQELISLGVPAEKVKYEFFGPAQQI